MSRASRALMLFTAALLFAALLGSGGRGFGREEPPAQGFDRLRRGMTPDQVRGFVGPPRRIARQILYHRHIEQWFYDPPRPTRLQFDCPRGQIPFLLWVSPPPADWNGRR